MYKESGNWLYFIYVVYVNYVVWQIPDIFLKLSRHFITDNGISCNSSLMDRMRRGEI